MFTRHCDDQSAKEWRFRTTHEGVTYQSTLYTTWDAIELVTSPCDMQIPATEVAECPTVQAAIDAACAEVLDAGGKLFEDHEVIERDSPVECHA